MQSHHLSPLHWVLGITNGPLLGLLLLYTILRCPATYTRHRTNIVSAVRLFRALTAALTIPFYPDILVPNPELPWHQLLPLMLSKVGRGSRPSRPHIGQKRAQHGCELPCVRRRLLPLVLSMGKQQAWMPGHLLLAAWTNQGSLFNDC